MNLCSFNISVIKKLKEFSSCCVRWDDIISGLSVISFLVLQKNHMSNRAVECS